MFYFSSDDLEIAGASPETLVKVDKQTAYTFPLAGTRPRGKDEKEDQELEADLLADEKELAEKYRELFCRKNGSPMEYFEKWLPIVAASQSVKGKPDERDFLISWADVVDYE